MATTVNKPIKMATPPSPDELEPSDAAKALAAEGIRPNEPDVNAMLKMIQDLTAKVNDLTAASGQTGDPVADAVANLKAHTKVRQAMHPLFDFSVLTNALDGMSDVPTADEAQIVRNAVDEVLDAGRNLEVHYLKALARDLHTAVLKAV